MAKSMLGSYKRPMLGSAFVSTLTVWIASASLQTSVKAQHVPSPQIISPSSPSAAEWYVSATVLLKKGRNFTQAADQLRKAIALQNQSKYHAALGCALASRATALMEAASHLSTLAVDQTKYHEWLTAWEAAQKDRNNPNYGKPRPQPPVLKTKDDQRPFTLTMQEAMKQYDVLSTQAQGEWSIALASAASPAERAEANYIQGWGLQILLLNSTRNHLPDAPDEKAILQAFTAATEMAPKTARYWQSLGDAKLGTDWNLQKTKDKAGALKVYQRSLALKNDNASLWYRVYDLLKSESPEQAQAALRQASLAEPDNAYPVFRLAGLMLNNTPYKTFHTNLLAMVRKNGEYDPESITRQIISAPDAEASRRVAGEAITLIEQGNKATRFVMPEYMPSISDLLAAAWYFQPQYTFMENTSTISWHAITMPAAGYATIAAQQGNREEAIRACHAILNMGFKIMGNLANQPMPLDTKDLGTLSAGYSIVGGGYRALIDVYKTLNDTQNVETTSRDYNTFQKKVSQYWKSEAAAKRIIYGNL